MQRMLKKDQLTVIQAQSRDEMGQIAARDIADCILELLKTRDELNMIFAAAPSQNEVLQYLVENPKIPWNKINAFHMDEYIGLAQDAPQGFANFLRRAIFDRVAFKSVNILDSSAAPEAEVIRYSSLLMNMPTDIVCLGIGENGHIAFNDPHVADFHDPVLVKVVELDEVCRMQQVHDGCFQTLADVPRTALTLTIPALARAKYHFCVVPASTKAWAVAQTIHGEIGAHCPASILRTLDHAALYCDRDSGKDVIW